MGHPGHRAACPTTGTLSVLWRLPSLSVPDLCAYSARTTMANDVQIRRNPLCPLRPVWLMHSTSTAAPSVEAVACQSQ